MSVHNDNDISCNLGVEVWISTKQVAGTVSYIMQNCKEVAVLVPESNLRSPD